jgi:hypothetical protein
MKYCFPVSLLLFGSISLSNGISAESATDPIYLKVGHGWKGLYGHGNAYAEFDVKNDTARFQDPYHVLLQTGVGMMISFVDKKELRDQKDLLTAHANWESIAGVNVPAKWKAMSARI